MKTILITGGSGFIGTNLCTRLVNDGNRVLCLDNNYTGRTENIAHLLGNKNFAFIEHDVCNAFYSDEKIDQIYNLACPASPPAYQGIHAIETTKTCVLGALNMLELAKAHNAVILQASTSEIYGDPLESPQKESYNGNVNPIGVRACYDEGKRCAESLFFDYRRLYGINIKVVRIFNTYGPFMNPNDGRVISNFICQALSGKALTVYGDGSQTRSFCYVDDLIDIMIKVMNSPESFTGPINIGNPDEFTVQELAERIIDNIGGTICRKNLPNDDPRQRKPDLSLAQSEFNWQPKISLDDGLDKTIAYLKTQIHLFKNRN